MTVTIRLEGSEQLRRELRRLSGDLRQAAADTVEAVALDLQKDVKKSIRSKGKGRTYTHFFYTTKNGKLAQGRKRAKPHTASAEGDPPATDTGRLLNSITFDRLGDLTAVVETKVEYAAHLEYGTERMAARPFFRPAVERMRPKYIGKLEELIGRAMK